MESKGDSSVGSNQQLLPNVVNPNTRITPSLFNSTNYKEEQNKKDPKYSDWVSENMLIMNWIINSMEEGISRSFKYSTTAKELWDSIEAAYAQKRNNARIFELKMVIASFQQGTLSIGDYHSRFRVLWIELESSMSPEPCCAKKQAKLLERSTHI